MYDRKIIYLHRYEGEVDKGNVGYIKQENRNGTISFTTRLMNIPPVYKADSVLVLRPFGHTLCKIHIENGTGRGMAICEEKTLNQEGIYYEKIGQYEIKVSENVTIWGEISAPKKKREEVVPLEKEDIPLEKEIASESITYTGNIENKALENEQFIQSLPDTMNRMEKERPTYSSKWDHISSGRKKVSFAGRESEYVKIAPEDMIALSNPYHSLVNNAFLLHGYYNYQHLILGPSKGNKSSFFIGVPGNFYKQEVNAARMFGFEYFENGQDKVEVGDFGYYMKKVKL